MAKATPRTTISKKRYILLLLLVVGLYVLLPQLKVFRSSFLALHSADWSSVLIAVGFTALTYVAAALTYFLLAIRPLAYGRTLLVQLAGMFTNRLVPGGVGGIGANYLYLRKSHHSPTQAAGVVAANNLLGIVGHVVLLIGILAVSDNGIDDVHIKTTRHELGLMLIIVAIILATLLLIGEHLRSRIEKGIVSTFKQLLRYRKHPRTVGAALLSSMALTLASMLSFYACARALHVGLSFLVLAIVFTLGVAVGTATPTPGGLGGVEAGMVAGMVAYHISSAVALATVLVYRLVSYWLALAVGGVAFAVVQHRGYFEPTD